MNAPPDIDPLIDKGQENILSFSRPPSVNIDFMSDDEYFLSLSNNYNSENESNKNNETTSPKATNKQKSKFTEEEDQIIRAFVSKNGPKSWKKAQPLLPGRTPRQIRERWVNYLSPEVSHEPWTKEEDDLILNLVDKYGKKWSHISRSFKKRTDVSIKNRFTLLLRRKKAMLRKEMLSKIPKKAYRSIEALQKEIQSQMNPSYFNSAPVNQQPLNSQPMETPQAVNDEPNFFSKFVPQVNDDSFQQFVDPFVCFDDLDVSLDSFNPSFI